MNVSKTLAATLCSAGRRQASPHPVEPGAPTAVWTSRAKACPPDSFNNPSPQQPCAAPAETEPTRAVPSASFGGLPAELKESILRACDDVGELNLAFVDAATLALARKLPELRWQQRQLDDAVAGLTEDRLVAALEQHLRLLRCRREPLLLPQDTSMRCLQAIAKLVAKSRQRPMLVLSFESPRAHEHFPPELTVKKLSFCENMDESIRRRYRACLTFTPTLQDFHVFELMKADSRAITGPAEGTRD